MQKYCLPIILLFISFVSWSQSTIKGKISDDSDNSVVENAIILFYNDSDNKILEYTNSNSEGDFRFSKTFSEGIYRLEISKLGYEKSVQKIIIGTDSSKIIETNISLKQKPFEIEEVSITIESPIIVKKDTIIYNIDRFTDKHDESLEEVLSKIEGFKIQANGDIEVNGKTIQKVLIDGKEVSDFGSALISKSLSPEKVKSVEVRFDEKNKKIKESLLNDEKFVVLDIKLKEDVNKFFFGKQQITLGYQDNTKIGGLTNLFSLNKKINIQFFAENNNFGKNTIKLSHIRNIGEEASAKMFSLPVDIDDVKQRSGYHDEIYGFNNFTSNDNSIVGLSVNLPLTEKTDLYFGSFNNYNFLRNQFSRNQYFDDFLIGNFSENNFINEYNSKNKLQLKHTSDNFKLSSDVNYVYFDQKLNNSVLDNFDNEFSKKHYSNNLYFNNSMEYLFSEKLGLSSNFSYSKEDFDILSTLFTTNTDVNDYLGLNENFRQNNFNTQSVLNNSLGITYKSEVFGTHSVGYKYHSNILENEKESNSNDFNANFQKYTSESHSITYNTSYSMGKLYLNLGLEYSFFEFPFEENNNYFQKNDTYFQYRFNANYDFDNFTNLSFLTSKNIDVFPLQKTTFGNVLMDFQTVFQTNQSIEPYYNTTYSLVFNKVFRKKAELTIAYLRGISENLNSQSFDNNLVFLQSNQLSSDYHAFSTSYKSRFSRNFTFVLEPEFIINSSEYILNNRVEHTTAYRFLNGLKLNYNFNDRISIIYYPKYSHFIFENSIVSSQKNTFNFLTNYLGISSFFLEKKLMTQLSYKQVNFFQNKSNFNNFDIDVVYKTKKFRYFVAFSNIFNSEKFITQDLNQSLLNVNNNQVFGRYVNFGFEFKIN